MTYIIQKKLRYLENCGRINETKNYIQHGSISVYTHCVNVARMSVKIAKWLPIQVNMDALVIGALLHDYFLYDWHDGEGRHLPGSLIQNVLLGMQKRTIHYHHELKIL